jgi:peptide/nickel transport system ATP-binding protein
VSAGPGIASRPRVLVCDEITSALDSVTRAAILDLLAELRDAQDLALLVISHDVQVVRALADDVHELGGQPARLSPHLMDTHRIQ